MSNPRHNNCRSQWSRGLRLRSASARLLRLWVRIQPGAQMFVCCECCVLSGRGLCDELIIHPKESYRLWCVVVCDLKTSWIRKPWPTGGCRAKKKKQKAKEAIITKIMCWYGTYLAEIWGPHSGFMMIPVFWDKRSCRMVPTFCRKASLE
jgi:hypothetical protein